MGADASVWAQEDMPVPRPAIFQAELQAEGPASLKNGNLLVRLWGVEAVPGTAPALRLKARAALAEAVGNNPVQCEIKSRRANEIFAQCVSSTGLDLGLLQLQHGYVSTDRDEVYGTVFEAAYAQAEEQAQEDGLGVWAVYHSGGILTGVVAALALCTLAACAALGLYMRRGFKQVLDIQSRNLDMMNRESMLREKERNIAAVMFESEIKVNKSRIEAFIAVYEDMLRALRSSGPSPRYQKAGDIIQKQPALSRSVFDRNADKLDILGTDLSSRLIHFYARIKTNPEYLDLEPGTALEDAIAMVERVLKNAQALNSLAENLIEAFADRETVAIL
jgi:hypothetical protein